MVDEDLFFRQDTQNVQGQTRLVISFVFKSQPELHDIEPGQVHTYTLVSVSEHPIGGARGVGVSGLGASVILNKS